MFYFLTQLLQKASVADFDKNFSYTGSTFMDKATSYLYSERL